MMIDGCWLIGNDLNKRLFIVMRKQIPCPHMLTPLVKILFPSILFFSVSMIMPCSQRHLGDTSLECKRFGSGNFMILAGIIVQTEVGRTQGLILDKENRIHR